MRKRSRRVPGKLGLSINIPGESSFLSLSFISFQNCVRVQIPSDHKGARAKAICFILKVAVASYLLSGRGDFGGLSDEIIYPSRK